jgi:hypothetical protein
MLRSYCGECKLRSVTCDVPPTAFDPYLKEAESPGEVSGQAEDNVSVEPPQQEHAMAGAEQSVRQVASEIPDSEGFDMRLEDSEREEDKEEQGHVANPRMALASPPDRPLNMRKAGGASQQPPARHYSGNLDWYNEEESLNHVSTLEEHYGEEDSGPDGLDASFVRTWLRIRETFP